MEDHIRPCPLVEHPSGQMPKWELKSPFVAGVGCSIDYPGIFSSAKQYLGLVGQFEESSKAKIQNVGVGDLEVKKIN